MGMELSNFEDKGQALVLVFFFLLIVGILTGSLGVMWQAEIQNRSLERDGLMALNLTQAGIEGAKIWARYNPDSFMWPLSPYDSGWLTLSGGRYRFFVANLGGLERRLTAYGQRLAGAVGSTVMAERQITVDITGIENPFSNPSNDQQISWSWREI
jgi:hypothetical protein